MVATGLTSAVVAQTPGDEASPLGVGTLIAQIGFAAIFLWQWRSERDERIKLYDKVINILERQGPVLAEAIDTLKAVQNSQRNIVTHSAQDWDRLVEAVTAATRLRGGANG